MKVLVFDDEEDILEICRYVLEKAGFEVATKSSCENVIEDLKTYRPDIVIMDNLIPELGGVKASLEIKNNPEFRDTPVIFFTASKDINKLVMESKADAYIEKPFDISELEDTVRKTIRKKQEVKN